MISRDCITTKKEALKRMLREMLARKMSTTIWGQGYIFQTKETKIENKFKRFEKINRFFNLMGFVEKQLSLYGRVVITLSKTKSGDVMLNVPNPYYFNGVAKCFVQPQLAVIWQRYEVDQENYIVKTTYDCEKVVNELYSKEQVRVFDKEAKILEMLQIEKVWKHNLGFVPVVEFTNLPFYQFVWNNAEYSSLADWAPAEIYEDLIYNTIQNLKKELYFCHSRVLISNANQELMETFKKIGVEEDVDFSDIILETDVGGEFKPMAGNGDFTKYTQTIDHLLDFYIKFAGGSKFSDGGGAQKTVAETSVIRSSMIESVNAKILLRNEQTTDLIKKVLCAYGVVKDYWECEENFTFEINGNVSKDETTFIDNIIKKIETGIISVPQAIQEIYNLSVSESEEKFQEIKQFNEENDIMTTMGNASMLDYDSGDSGFNENGEHTKLQNKQGSAA